MSPNQLWVKISTYILPGEKSCPKMRTKKLPKVNSHPIGDISPNQVTLLRAATDKTNIKFCNIDLFF
jgi:hypothetical protein